MVELGGSKPERKQTEIKPIEIPQLNFRGMKSEEVVGLTQRISRLIYHQLKITAMEYDRLMLLCSNEEIAEELLLNEIQMSQRRAREIIHLAFDRQ
jgi:hypothetical protein